MSDIKKRLNITGKCYVKQNKANGTILSFLTDVPIQANLADLLFIMTIPGKDQKFALAYCRLQNKIKNKNDFIEFKDLDNLDEIRSVCYLKETKKGSILVCAPKENKLIDLDKLVIIATIPTEGKTAAPCFIRRKLYEKSKDELNAKNITVGEIITNTNKENNNNSNYLIENNDFHTELIAKNL